MSTTETITVSSTQGAQTAIDAWTEAMLESGLPRWTDPVARDGACTAVDRIDRGATTVTLGDAQGDILTVEIV